MYTVRDTTIWLETAKSRNIWKLVLPSDRAWCWKKAASSRTKWIDTVQTTATYVYRQIPSIVFFKVDNGYTIVGDGDGFIDLLHWFSWDWQRRTERGLECFVQVLQLVIRLHLRPLISLASSSNMFLWLRSSTQSDWFASGRGSINRVPTNFGLGCRNKTFWKMAFHSELNSLTAHDFCPRPTSLQVECVGVVRFSY